MSVYPDSVFVTPPSLSDFMNDLSDLQSYVQALAYNETGSEVGLTIEVKDSPSRLTAGKQLTLKGVFTHPDLVSQRNKNNQILWSVYGKDGHPVEGITVSKSGALSVSKKIEENTDIIVEACSASFLTRAYYPLQIIPVVTAVTADPAELFFYLGSTPDAEVQAALTPACVPADVLSWKSSSPRIAEVTDAGDGKAVVHPASVGKTTVTVSEAGGKKAAVKITVAQEVTDIELSYGGKTRPGSSGTVRAVIAPKMGFMLLPLC